MLNDGNLIFLDDKNTTLYESNTTGLGDRFVLENNCMISIYDKENNLVWLKGDFYSKLYLIFMYDQA